MKYVLILRLVAAWLAIFPKVARCVPTFQTMQNFTNDLLLRNLFISNPYEADITSSYNSTLHVVISDGDYPNLRPVHCQVQWRAGVGPPAATNTQCENATTRLWFPLYTFRGVKNFQMQVAHTVIDIRVGECPQYCRLTKYASINITDPGTTGWACDGETAVCQQQINSTLNAPVYLAIA